MRRRLEGVLRDRIRGEQQMTLKEFLAAAVRADHGSACVGARRRIASVRRVALVAAAIFAARALGESAHFEVLHEGCKAGIDGLIAYLVERVCAVE
ncbi:hypothetical protein [Paraburkholderia sp. 35.1]|uniref:hypothetical protein n=1 Tax=Paraburkholderia sp. 35.1 TaxID=2991058 RepID=UPI003D1C3EBD